MFIFPDDKRVDGLSLFGDVQVLDLLVVRVTLTLNKAVIFQLFNGTRNGLAVNLDHV